MPAAPGAGIVTRGRAAAASLRAEDAAAGNLTQDGSVTPVYAYSWDAEGRLTSVTQSGTTLATYTYNALGQKVDTTISGVNYYESRYDPAGNLLAYWSGFNLGWYEYLEPLAGRPLAMYFDSEFYTEFEHPNHLGSWTVLSKQDGTVNQDMLYYPWGQAWTGANAEQRFASLGKHETETGLDWTMFRRYSSNQGRWLTPDPKSGSILDPQSLNRYAYVRNDPCTHTDPLGLGKCQPASGLASIVDEFSVLNTEGYNQEGPLTVTFNPQAAELFSPYNAVPTVGRPGCSQERRRPQKPNPLSVALDTLLKDLLSDPDCYSFLTLGTSGPAHPLTSLENTPIVVSQLPSDIAAETTTSPSGTSTIDINSQGAFFKGSYPNGKPLDVGTNQNPIRGGTPEARAFILLHELGHITDALKPDFGNPSAEAANNAAILKHCKKTLGKFK